MTDTLETTKLTLTHGATIRPDDPTRAPRRDQEAQPPRSTLMRYAGAALLAAFLAGLPAGCSTPEEANPAAAAALSCDPGHVDEAWCPTASASSDDMTDKERAFVEKLPQLMEIQARFEPELSAYQGMNSIGIGLATDGVTPVFRIAVSNPELRERLPRTVEGVPVEIHVAGPVRLMNGGPGCNGPMGPPECHADQQPLPVEMGNSGAWFLGSACTMGFKACDLTTGESVLVTNSHCADYPGNCALAGIGDPFKHTSPNDMDPPGSGVTIGTIAGHAAPSCQNPFGNFTDATKVTSSFYESSRHHRDIGKPKNVPGDSIPGRKVHYSGRTTGYNQGEITAINVTVWVPAQGGFCCGGLTMWDQVSFTPDFPVQGGDSGSGVLLKGPFPASLRHNRIAGLLWGQDNAGSYYNNIHRVLDALDLTLDFTECGFPPEY
jgi:hypothetical protein